MRDGKHPPRAGQHDFGVTGQFDGALHVGMIGEGHASQLHIVFRRDADFGVDFQIGMVLTKLGARLGEDGFATFGRAKTRLMSGRPEFAGGHIAQVDKCSPAIARSVLAPAGDGQIAPTAVAAAGAADHDVVAAVGQELNFGRGQIGIGEQRA